MEGREEEGIVKKRVRRSREREERGESGIVEGRGRKKEREGHEKREGGGGRGKEREYTYIRRLLSFLPLVPLVPQPIEYSHSYLGQIYLFSLSFLTTPSWAHPEVCLSNIRNICLFNQD